MPQSWGDHRWGRQGPNFHTELLTSSLDWSVLQEKKLDISPERLHSVLHGNWIGSAPKAAPPLGRYFLVS